MTTAIASCLPEPKVTHQNPTSDQLKEFVSQMPTAALTEFGNYNVTTKVLARSKASTFIVTDTPENHSDQCISSAEGEQVAELQNEFIKDQEMIIIDGYIGSDPLTRTSVRLMVEKKYANIAAMQQQLYFPVAESEKRSFTPELHVIYTPSLKMPGYPNDRLIAVDLDKKITRVFNSDYFGESKKGGLRMWNQLMFDCGGLAMHAGCKVIPTTAGDKVGLIIGLSGTGKTTTTFTSQNNSTPIQDDFIALMSDGSCLTSENGCFAKTFALDPNNEPAIHGAVVRPNACLENVSMDAQGKIDFFDTSYTQNGRATFPFSSIDANAANRKIDHVDFILILNKNESIIPAVAKLNAEQAADYFMLGETMGTSAGGAEEAGKSLRIPGTNPFFPLLHSQQGSRFLELTQKFNIPVYLMNTGRVGGSEAVAESQKVKIRHSSAIVKAIAENTIQWKEDTDFGYQIAESVPGVTAEDSVLLEPKALYQKMGKLEAYNKICDQLKSERKAYLAKFNR